MRTIRRWSLAASLLLLAGPAAARAEGEGEETTVEELRRRLDEMQRRHDAEMGEVRAELDRLRAERAPGTPVGGDLGERIEEYLDRVEDLEGRVRSLSAPAPRAKLLDISLLGLFAAGASTATEEELAILQGGGHDPHKRGFTVQNFELSFSGAVDPWFRADAAVVIPIDSEGETVVELEEAFLTTTSLPAGLQVRAGQFFTDFGRLNPTHPHAWDFVDQPVVNTRFFGGDGMRGPGAQVSWLAPTEFPLLVSFTGQNADGATMASFLGGDLPGGRPAAAEGVRSAADLAYTGRLAATFEAGTETVLMSGVSTAFGPNGTGSSARTRVDGVDFTLKWRPAAADHGFPFVTWQTEWLQRRFVADEHLAAGEAWYPHAVLEDRGFYSQVTWGFARGWTAGARWERVDGSGGGASGDPLRDRRTRGSLALTWFPSECSRLRLQVNRDDSETLGDSVSVWLQWEFLLGAHGAHGF